MELGYMLLISALTFSGLLLPWIINLIYSVIYKPLKIQRDLKKQGITGPPYQILFGSLKQQSAAMKQARERPMELSHNILPRVSPFFKQIIKQHGKSSVFWYGTRPRVIVMDPEIIREVFSNKLGHLEQWWNPLMNSLATGLVSYNGEKWSKHRRILSPAFHLEKIKRMLPAFSISCEEMVRRWGCKVSEQTSSCEVDVWPDLQRLTADVISRAAFGSSYEEGNKIFDLQTELGQLIFQAAMSLPFPGRSFLPTKNNLRRKEISREVRSKLKGIIEKRETAMKLGEAPSDDLLGLLIESNKKYSQVENALTIDDIIEECKLFYFAGQETTSILLTWTMITLAMHPEWQTRAREEVLQIFGKDKPDIDGLSHLKIIPMILHEVLRLYPPAINIARTVKKEIKIGDITYPAGVDLSLPIILVHHDHELWGDDADKFNPERFAEGVSKATKNSAIFFPFGGGNRLCIGYNFALLEAKLAVSLILQRFWFELSPSYAHAPYTVLTLQPQYGAQMILHKLQEN